MSKRAAYNRRRKGARQLAGAALSGAVAVSLVLFGSQPFGNWVRGVFETRVGSAFAAETSRPNVLRGGGAMNSAGGARTDRAPLARAAGRGDQLIDAVTRVRDGDTIVVGLIPIRIANLDCAESGTVAGDRATRRMHALVRGQHLTCRLEGRRSHDREVGVCALPGGLDVGQVMIAEGLCRRWPGY